MESETYTAICELVRTEQAMQLLEAAAMCYSKSLPPDYKPPPKRKSRGILGFLGAADTDTPEVVDVSAAAKAILKHLDRHKYDALGGCAQTATTGELKKAYYKLCRGEGWDATALVPTTTHHDHAYTTHTPRSQHYPLTIRCSPLQYTPLRPRSLPPRQKLGCGSGVDLQRGEQRLCHPDRRG